jgi:hypothetical protein
MLVFLPPDMSHTSPRCHSNPLIFSPLPLSAFWNVVFAHGLWQSDAKGVLDAMPPVSTTRPGESAAPRLFLPVCAALEDVAVHLTDHSNRS